MGIEPTNAGSTNRCVNHFATIAIIRMEGGRFELPNPKERIYSPPRLATSLSLHHIKNGPRRIRTADTLSFNQVLYQLSYQTRKKLKTAPTGFEPAISCVTGRHVDPYTTEPMEVDGIEPPTSCL